MSNNKPFTDRSIMPYGKHKGKMMANVPADYLLFIWENHELRGPLKEYISENLEVIKKQVAYEKKQNNAGK